MPADNAVFPIVSDQLLINLLAFRILPSKATAALSCDKLENGMGPDRLNRQNAARPVPPLGRTAAKICKVACLLMRLLLPRWGLVGVVLNDRCAIELPQQRVQQVSQEAPDVLLAGIFAAQIRKRRVNP